MSKEKKYKSDISQTIHQMAKGLHKAGFMDDAQMSTFDATCLVPDAPMTPRKIKAIRKKADISQATLAACLNVKTNTVSKWEQGCAQPTGPAARLLNVIDHHGLGVLMA